MLLRTGVQADYIERDITRNQRSLVDNCLEEGQYESAIAVLEQLRSSKYKQTASHIRVLLYFALYPPLPSSHEQGNDKPSGDQSSPRKTAKQPRSAPAPSQSVTAAAQRLLVSFANTNSPAALFRALPRYPDTSSGEPDVGEDEEDSLIAVEATCIKESKHCWNILKEGFIQRRREPSSAPKGKRRKLRTEIEDEDVFSDPLVGDTPAVIAENAWPVLDWILGLLERDECMTEDRGLSRHSPLLLSQIPPPRGGTGPRWDTDAPLDIVFYCMGQTDQRRRSMGCRLMTLLINLLSTIHLDMPMFVASVFGRLSASVSDDISTLFSSLTPSLATLRFKIALCQKFLGDTAMNSYPAQVGPRPKPQARAQARAAHAPRRSLQDQKEISTRSVPLPSDSQSITSKHSLPSSDEILRLLGADPGPSCPTPVASILRIKFELLVSYGTLQSSDAEDKDLEWPNLLHDGRLAKTLDLAFGQGSEAGRMYRESLKAIMCIW